VTGVLWVSVGMAVAWAVFAVVGVGAFIAKYRQLCAEEAAAEQHAPGGLTGDLGTCWAIWPDAPLAEEVLDDD